MIAYLTGEVINKGLNYIILDVSGVGYKVFTTPQAVLELGVGQKIDFFVFTYVREDQISLYGFIQKNELDLFELLISVSGVGSKVALSVMSGANAAAIISAIQSGDPAVFTKVSGVGKKTGERIVMELKEKIQNTEAGENLRNSRELSESLEALIALGYAEKEAREALKKIPADLSESSNIVKAALKILGQR